MDVHSNALYNPYGAHELKAKYQRNYLVAEILTIVIVGVVTLTFRLVSDAKGIVDESDTERPPRIRPIINPPPIIERENPIGGSGQDVSSRLLGIPNPVPDDAIEEFDTVVVMGDYDPVVINRGDFDSDRDGDSFDSDRGIYYPSIDSFVPVESMPEMIYEVKPEYPRLAEIAGMEGVVWIAVLVSKDGKVVKAALARSSGNGSLDQAALAVAKRNRFKPGVQNGKPVAVWVTYQVEFVVED